MNFQSNYLRVLKFANVKNKFQNDWKISSNTKQFAASSVISNSSKPFSSHGKRGGMEGVKGQASHRIKEKVGLKVEEKTVQQLPRLAILKKRLGFALLTRKLFRGVAIALPGRILKPSSLF